MKFNGAKTERNKHNKRVVNLSRVYCSIFFYFKAFFYDVSKMDLSSKIFPFAFVAKLKRVIENIPNST